MNETMNLRKSAGLERAIEIAVSAHKGQVDKAGAPYIMHPLRVMMSLSTEAERIVGVLHDVVEDSDWNFELLKEEGFEDQILVALASVTAIPGESYDDFIVRAASNPIGKQVKIADLKDNMDMKRISDPTDRDFERLKKYSRSLAYLQDGNASKFSA
jgi:(p)ppGpp synthase/HD superfamily hydrolase